MVNAYYAFVKIYRAIHHTQSTLMYANYKKISQDIRDPRMECRQMNLTVGQMYKITAVKGVGRKRADLSRKPCFD